MPDTALQPLPVLSARSVVLSILLGSHPDRLTPAQITGTGTHLGIPAATLRVALTRAVASGDLRRDGSDYVLGERLAARQRRQDEAVEDAETAWDGEWEMAVVVVTGRTGPERAALRETLTLDRLAELREGVWCRPGNLRRTPAHVGDPVLTSFRVRPETDAQEVVARLWDLDAWASTGEELLARLVDAEGITSAAERLSVAAAVVRHLTADPLLPAELLPAGWPGARLRAAYADYRRELRTLTG